MTPPSSAPNPRDPVPDSAPYPAPYEEPWGRLLGDLQAVVASAGLKLRELWRRNREGDLSVPGFWPVSFAPWFWPLLLTVGLALVLGLILRVAAAQHPATPRVQGTVQRRVSQAGQRREPKSLQPAGQPQTLPETVSPSPPPAQPQPSPEPPLELDPLLALLTENEAQSCIASAHPDPQASRLDLGIAPAYQALPHERRQQLADHWLEQTRGLGYEWLRLLDGNGTVLGQAARVGTGMVLLEPTLQPQA